MWPMLLDYTRDECKRILRKLELEAYASVVSAFRAQGDLSKEKKKMLQDLSVALSISLERHRAEVRRAVNDEHLNTIADRLAGPNTSTEWAIEGRRLVPLMPRLVPQTAFTAIANSAANAQAAKNAAMPVPSATGLKESFSMPSTPVNGTIAVTQPTCPPTPIQNVRSAQHQNSGKSISSVSNSSIIVLNDGDNEDTENNLRKRKRSSSLDSGGGTPQKLMMSESTSPDPHMLCGTSSMASATECLPASSVTQVTTSTISQPIVTRTVTLPVGPNPLRITLTTVAHRTTNTVSTASTPKQVILVSTSGASISPSILQRSLNVPVVKTVSTATTLVTTHQGKPCVSTPGITVSSNVLQQNANSTSISLNSEMTPTTSSLLSSVPPVLSTSGGFTQTISTSTAPMSSTLLSRARPKTPSVPRHQMRPRSSSGNTVTTQPQMMNQQGPSPQLPSPNTLQPAQRAHSPISRTRSPASRTPSPASAAHMPRSQSPASGQALPCAQSPAAAMPRAPSPATSTPRAQSPVAATRSQSPVSMQMPPKTAVSPKGASKSSVHRPPAVSGSRTLLTSSTKTSVKTLSPAISSMQCSTRTPLQPSIRPQVSTQQSIQAPSRTPCPQQQTQKISQGQVQLKSTGPSPRTVQYRNEGGLKIITQNVSSSRILPKPPVSTVQNFTGSNRLNTITSSTSGVTGNARIVNFQQQMGVRMARAISPSAITALGLQSGMPATALRVTLPAGTLGTPAVVRATAPGAKPNVIVVHKAQVWPQSQGATIVVSSSGPMSRIPAEAVQEAVSFIQRQERNRQSGTLTLVKSVTVTQPSTTLVSTSTTNTISSVSTAGSTNTISNLDTFQPDCTQESDCSNLQLQEKLSESDRKNTLLADIIQAAGILPDNSSMPLIDDTQTGEQISAREDSVTAQVSSAIGDSCQAEMHKSSDLTRSLIVEGDLYDKSMGDSEASPKTPDSVAVTKDKPLIENESDSSSSIMELKDWTPQSFNPSPPTKKKNEKSAAQLVDVVEESTPSISIQDINLDQLQEGQILELQAQDAAELLSQHGQLSKEVLELLQQAGLQVQQVEVQDCETGSTKIQSPDASENNREPQSHCDEATELKGKLETELDPQTGILYVTEDLKSDPVASETTAEFKNEATSSLKPDDRSVVDIFSTALASAQLDLHALEFVDDVIAEANNMSQTSKNASSLSEVSNASNISQHGSAAESDATNSPLSTVKEPTVSGADVASPLLSSTSQPHSDEDILLVPIDIDDPNVQSSGELHSQNSKRDQTRSVVVETMPDMSALTLPPGALVVSNITVELGGLDTSTMKLEDFTSQQVDCNIKDSTDETLEESNSSGQVQHYDSKVGSSSTETREFASAQQKKCRFLPEEISTYISPHLSGWSRMASGLLDRAIKHKKSVRPNISHWILNQDVSTSAVHENFKIMDFSTIRSKLENRTYLNFREFHADMMLVKDICQKYSAFGHNYTDCADMFAFYLQEYNRLADKWQKSHLLSSSKRIKTS